MHHARGIRRLRSWRKNHRKGPGKHAYIGRHIIPWPAVTSVDIPRIDLPILTSHE